MDFGKIFFCFKVSLHSLGPVVSWEDKMDPGAIWAYTLPGPLAKEIATEVPGNHIFLAS